MQALSFEKLPPEQQVLAKECGRDVLGMEDVRGGIASCKPPASSADVLVLPGAGRLGAGMALGYHNRCGYFWHFLCVIQTPAILSSVVEQGLRFSMPVLSWTADDKPPPCLYHPWGSSLTTMPLQAPWPLPLPWLSPLGTARRKEGGRWMAETLPCFGEPCFSAVASSKMHSGLSQTPTARSAALGS